MSWNRYKTRFSIDHTDLPDQKGINVVQIAGIDSEENVKTKFGERTFHMLRLTGWTLPLRLNNGFIAILSSLFGDDEQNAIGQKIGLHVGAVTKADDTVGPGILMHIQPVPAKVPAIDEHGRLLRGTIRNELPEIDPIDNRPIGEANAKKFLVALGKHGKSWSDWVKWVRNEWPTMLVHVSGIEFAETPVGVLGLMKQYLDHLAKPSPADPKQIPGVKTGAEVFGASMGGDVIDPQTGEVIPHGHIQQQRGKAAIAANNAAAESLAMTSDADDGGAPDPGDDIVVPF